MILYRGPCALITHEVFQVRCPTYRSYAIHELDEVCVLEERWWPRRRRRQLWAVYQGRWTCLFGSSDARVFGQVRRALVRAVEVR